MPGVIRNQEYRPSISCGGRVSAESLVESVAQYVRPSVGCWQTGQSSREVVSRHGLRGLSLLMLSVAGRLASRARYVFSSDTNEVRLLQLVNSLWSGCCR